VIAALAGSRETITRVPNKLNEHHGTLNAPFRVVMHEQESTQGHAFSRSREMANCLRQEQLYSEKRPRDAMFRTIEALIAEQRHTGEHRIVSRLTREAAECAERVAGDADTVRWDITSRTVVKAMIGAEVLLTPDGRPIRSDITAQATPVAVVRDEFEDLTEAFLLETLIQRLNDVTTRDHRALAHVLFRRFDRSVPLADLEYRVVMLLARLADRVELQGDRYVARARRDPGSNATIPT
jgi:hypothetical protein